MKLTPAKVTMLMLLAVSGLIGIYVVKGLFAVEKKVERPRSARIPLATGNLSIGTKITREHIGMGPYPESELKEDMLRSERVIIGRVLKEAIKAGNPLRGTQLYEPGENAPLVVAEGMQAIAIPVKNSAEMVEGLIKPGNFVDVHFTLDTQSSNSIDSRIGRLGGVSMTLFKGVKVLALNKNFRQAPVLATGNSVTLELAPAQTNVILVTQSKGIISLTYNPTGEGDGGVALNNADRATLWEVLGIKKPAAKKPDPDPEKPFVTESFKGLRGGATEWDKNGKKWDGSANAGLGGTGSYSRTRDWPAGSGAGAGGGGGAGGGTYWGSNSSSDPYDYNGRGQSAGGGANGDDFDPSDVFESSGGNRGAAMPHDAAEPSADPDIPTNVLGTAQRGVRSRTSSILRATPQSRGPTALRD